MALPLLQRLRTAHQLVDQFPAEPEPDPADRTGHQTFLALPEQVPAPQLASPVVLGAAAFLAVALAAGGFAAPAADDDVMGAADATGAAEALAAGAADATGAADAEAAGGGAGAAVSGAAA